MQLKWYIYRSQIANTRPTEKMFNSILATTFYMEWQGMMSKTDRIESKKDWTPWINELKIPVDTLLDLE